MEHHDELEKLDSTDEELGRHTRAFLETAAERDALSEKEVRRVNLDIEEAISTATKTVLRVGPLLTSLSQLPIDFERVRKLELYTLALLAAHLRFRIAQKPPNGLDAVYREAIVARKMLRKDAENLMFHRLLRENQLEKLRFRMGHHNVAYDLMTLVIIYRQADSAVLSRSAVTPAQLDRAEKVADKLRRLKAMQSLEYRQKVDDDRRRAFTLLHRAYEELRRALRFVRWYDGDPATIAPALHSQPGAGRPKKHRPPTPARTNDPVTPIVVRQHDVTDAWPIGTVVRGLLESED